MGITNTTKEKLNNVFCPGKFSNLCFFGGNCLSNKCYTILKLISQGLIICIVYYFCLKLISEGLIICIVYYFWKNTFWEIVVGQWTIQLQNRTFSMSFLKSKSKFPKIVRCLSNYFYIIVQIIVISAIEKYCPATISQKVFIQK
jgi:hypothetical protein